MNTIQRDANPNWDYAIRRTVDAGGEYFDMVTSRRQRTTEAMYRKNWSAITHSRQIRRDHMQDAHLARHCCLASPEATLAA